MKKTISNFTGYSKRSERVPHNCKYHAEIKIETQNGFNYVSAVGETIVETIQDIEHEIKQNADRQPELDSVYMYPNGINIDITLKIKSLMGE